MESPWSSVLSHQRGRPRRSDSAVGRRRVRSWEHCERCSHHPGARRRPTLHTATESCEAMIREYVTIPPAFCGYDPAVTVVAEELISAIGAPDHRLRVEHVGSSSVPGCGGKGYVDLLVMYPDGLLDVAKKVLADLGFQPQSGRDPFPEERPMRVGSVERAGRRFPVHAHVVASSAPEVGEFLRFRDRLRSDPALQRAYEAEKQRILAGGVLDGVDYAEKKSPFVQGVLAGGSAR